MDFHAEMILEDYRNNLETFEIIKKVVLEQLNGYVKSLVLSLTVLKHVLRLKNLLLANLLLKVINIKIFLISLT